MQTVSQDIEAIQEKIQRESAFLARLSEEVGRVIVAEACQKGVFPGNECQAAGVDSKRAVSRSFVREEASHGFR